MITQPLLAETCKDITALRYPVMATPKIDGIRAIKVNGQLVSRKFKPIPNKYIRETLERILPDGMDGEILAGKNFQECTSAVMSRDGEPNFQYLIFDYIKDGLTKPYKDRVKDYLEWGESQSEVYTTSLRPVLINSAEELRQYEKKCLDLDYEGVMVRDPHGVYKCGRSTVKQGILLKIKQFVDSEAIVIGFEELMHNENVQKRDAFGHAERSHEKAGMVGAGYLGSLLVRDVKTGVEFGIGSGFDLQMRKTIWSNQRAYIGKLAKYKSFLMGVKEAPRFPVFLGFRHEDDL
jgi:DNA ligase 1